MAVGTGSCPLTVSEIGYNDSSANPSRLEIYYRSASAEYHIYFDLNTPDGNYIQDNLIDQAEAFGTGPQTLRALIESGRALYYNSKSADNIQTGTYIGDGTNSQQVHLGFRPKMVTVKGVSTTDPEATHSGTKYFYDQTVFDTLTESGDLIPRPYRATDSRISGHVGGERVPIEITDTGFKIVGASDGDPTNDSTPNMAGAKYHYFAIGKDVTFSDAGGSSSFAGLTDTPEALDAGSYLRVNTAGDAIEQIKTAPPDGGLGDLSMIQEASKFDGKIPDAILVDYAGWTMVLALRSINDSDANGSIEYMDQYTSAG